MPARVVVDVGTDQYRYSPLEDAVSGPDKEDNARRCWLIRSGDKPDIALE